MSARPPIIISTMDLHRLEKLFEDQPANSFAGMAELEAELVRAQLVEPAAIPADVVSMNSSVRFSVDGQEYVRTLVYPAALNDTDQQISVMAPVGSALLGMREGSSIDWPRHGGGSMNVNIDQIIYQPEREGQFHR
ncbi:MAG: nucleoside diphosphate kinase regulator [Pseudomonadota bacterium]|nr:MAG: nucleoside diphosphate kinase regulator [Pseudomonadota bacterium]